LIRRIPIRLRLSLAFALVMAILLGAMGGFIYLRLSDELDTSIRAELDARVGGVRALMIDEGNDIGRGGESPLEYLEDASVIQVLDHHGRVLEAGADAPVATPMLDLDRVLALDHGEELTAEVVLPELEDGHLRLVALAARTEEKGRARLYAIVGASLAERDAALSGLRSLLFVIAPIALLLTTVAGYLLALAALRPIEAMRRRAAELSAGETGALLPVPPADDEVSRLGRTLNELLERLQSAVLRERRLVADASHELRGPLAVLRTELELARRKDRTKEELDDVVESAAEEAERLAELADALLDLAAADRGTLKVTPELNEVRPLLESLRHRFEQQFAEAGRSIEVVAGDERVELDLPRVEQALGNLLQNALRYGRGAVTLEAVRSGNARIELAVRDRGEGFPPEFIVDAFDRFSRADRARGRGGAGLGLSIAAAIAAAHGGEAFAENPAGGGARVGIRLPTGT